jgi:hypothetical protein
MSTVITTTPATKRLSTLEALRILDSFVRDSEIGRGYADDTLSGVVADVIKRAERRKASKDIMPREDQISMHLHCAIDAMKASDPWMASLIENIEETLGPMRGV